MAIFNPLATAVKTPGLSLESLLCFFFNGRYIIELPLLLLNRASIEVDEGEDLAGEVVREEEKSRTELLSMSEFVATAARAL